MSVKPIPEGFNGVTPYLGIKRAAEAIEFYKQAFGAVETMRLEMPDGSGGGQAARGAGTEIRVQLDRVTVSDGIALTGVRGTFGTRGGFGGHLLCD